MMKRLHVRPLSGAYWASWLFRMTSEPAPPDSPERPRLQVKVVMVYTAR